MDKILKLTTKFPKILVVLMTILTIFFGYFSTKLEVDASTQTLLLENDSDLAKFKEIASRYESPNFLVVAYTPKQDLLSPKTLENIQNLSKEFSNLDFVQSIISILNVPLLQNGKSLESMLESMPTLMDKDINLTLAKSEFLQSPLYKNSLVSEDFKTTAIVLNLKFDEKFAQISKARDEILSSPNLDKEKLKAINKDFKIYRDNLREKEHKNIQKIREILSSNGEADELFLGGINMIADDMVNFVKNDLVIYGIGVLLLLVLCLWLFFRQVKFVILPIVICIYSVVFASGLFGFLGFEITVISSNYIALQLIITISVIIHLIVAYREYYWLYPEISQKELVFLAMKDRSFPCFFSIFTTIIGFCSLVLSDILPIIMLGIMMSVGIAISLIVAFVMFGAFMSLSSKMVSPRQSLSNFSLAKVSSNFAINYRNLVYFISILAVCIGLYGISKIKVENSFIGYFKEDTEIYKGMKVIDTKLGGTVPLDIVVKFPSKQAEQKSGVLDDFEAEFNQNLDDEKYWFSSQKMEIIKKIHNYLANLKFVGNVSSLSTLLEVGKALNDGKELDDFTLALIYNSLPVEYKKLLLTPYVNIQNNEAHFVLRTIDSDTSLRRNQFLQNLKNDLLKIAEQNGVTIEVSGVMVLYNNMLQSLVSSQINTLGAVVLVLFVLFIFIFRSVKLAILGLLSNLIPLCLVFGIMGIFGIPLDIMSITIAAISIGIGVDNIIHYLYRYKKELKSNSSVVAIQNSHQSIGYAMFYTSFTILLGFSIMVFSNFWPTIYFGLLTDLVMGFMLFGSLILLPSFLLSFYSKICKNE